MGTVRKIGENCKCEILLPIAGEEEGAREKFANIDEASNHIPIVVELDSG